MGNQILGTLGFLLLGGFVSVVGVFTVRYPEVSYRIRKGWRYDEVSLSSRGRTDEQGVGVVLAFLGLVIMYVGIAR